MPSAKGPAGALTPAMLRYIAVGGWRFDPAVDGDFQEHLGRDPLPPDFEEFMLRGRWINFAMAPAAPSTVVAELTEFWERHREQIEAATPDGYEPFVVTLLREAERLQRGGAPRDDEDEQQQ